MKNVSKEKREQRFLLMVPILVLPFVTLAFWFLGGGKGNELNKDNVQTGGLKIELPNANIKDKQMDKMSYYDQARIDSLKRLEQIRNDPYYQKDTANIYRSYDQRLLGSNGSFEQVRDAYQSPQYKDPNEAKVYERLSSLNAILNQNSTTSEQLPKQNTINQQSILNKSEVDRLEGLMKLTQQSSEEPDTEMVELNDMLEKVLDIQHPERVQERLRKTSQQNKGQIYSVSANNRPTPISLLERGKGMKEPSGFFSLEEPGSSTDQEDHGTIAAVVHEAQTLVSGSIVKLRLISDVYINGILIPKGNFVFGVANLNGERLSIKIDNIRFKQSIFPVSLGVYDMDGIDGIHIPGAISRDVAKQSGSNALQGINMTTIDPSLGAQAATAGIELSKSLLGKKVKLVKVTVKAGYQVILKDLNQKN
ncbi:conjugative transposon protein TraM [Pedobacter sp. ASV28]|uniref:conjugative transposon protein TraM n=1 Tax=Pedobacter sp. ASV28 TaxID=2795123 RepID=UPI0018EBB2B4|nr:conjugative transposon protein TraM [Pedobacter sp. ASV28]